MVNGKNYADAKADMQNFLNTAVDSVKIMGINMEIARLEPHDKLRQLATSNISTHDLKTDDRTMREMWERQQLMMSHVLQNKLVLALEMLESYIDMLSPLNWNDLLNGMVDLFANLNNNLRRYDSRRENNEQFSYSDLLSLKNVSEVRKWSIGALKGMMSKSDIDIKSSGNSIIYGAKCYIEENYSRDLTLSDVADHVFLSPVYLSRLFKESTGMNFSEFLIDCRIMKACELLKNIQLKVYKICNVIGYTNVKYFYNLFRRKMGCTPSEYRHQ